MENYYWLFSRKKFFKTSSSRNLLFFVFRWHHQNRKVPWIFIFIGYETSMRQNSCFWFFYKWLESYNSIFEKSSPGEVSGFSISRAWPAIHDTPDQCLSKYQNFKYWLAKMTKLGCQGNTKNSVQIMVTWKAAERFGFGSIIVGKTKSTKTACKRKTKTNQKKGKTTPPTPINDKKQGEFKIVLLQSETTDVIDDWY